MTACSTPGSTSCLTCPAGNDCVNNTVSKCAVGHYSVAGSSACTECGAGMFSPIEGEISRGQGEEPLRGPGEEPLRGPGEEPLSRFSSGASSVMWNWDS